jgi:hypothetical protein
MAYNMPMLEHITDNQAIIYIQFINLVLWSVASHLVGDEQRVHTLPRFSVLSLSLLTIGVHHLGLLDLGHHHDGQVLELA